MAAGTLFLNGQDAESTFGFVVSTTAGGQAGSGRRLAAMAAGGVLGGPARSLPLLDIPQMPGSFDPGLPFSEDTRGIVINGFINASDYTTLYAALDTLKEVCGTGLVEIRTAYGATRAFYGVLETPDVNQYTENILNGRVAVTLAFTCPIPYAIALQHRTVYFGAVPVDIELGTAPSGLREKWSAMIEVVGASTTPTITYYDYRMNTISTIASTYSPLAGDTLLIDIGRKRARRFVSGVQSNAMGLLTAGYKFPALDPSDGVIRSGLYPKLSCSSGVASIRYYEAWR
jgi:hypothetical protein